MKITINRLAEEIKRFANEHLQLSTFYFGDFVDAVNDKEAVVYPLLVATPQPSTLTFKKANVVISFVVADKYNEGDVFGVQQVHSDLMQIATDLRAYLRNVQDEEWLDHIEVGDTVNLQPFINRGQDVTAGWVFTITFEIDDVMNYCAIPLVGATPAPPFTCDPATVIVLNSDNIEVDSGTVGSGATGTFLAPDGQLEINGDAAFTIPSGSTQNINLLDENDQPLEVIDVDGDDVKLNTWWKRNPDWLPLPEINVGDNRFVGLYAVFEDNPFNNTLTIQMTGGTFTVDLGDGNTLTTTGGIDTHVYDYATISSPIIQIDGVNAKMVVVDIDLSPSTTFININLASNIIGEVNKPSGWLDIVAGGENLREIRMFIANERFAPYLERFKVVEFSPSRPSVQGNLTNCNALKVLDFGIPIIDANILMHRVGDIRREQGQLIEIFDNNRTNPNNLFQFSSITRIGNLTFNAALICQSLFFSSEIRKCGNINIGNSTTFNRAFEDSKIRELGVITVTNNLNRIDGVVRNCRWLRELVFSGDLSSVNNISNAFIFTDSLRRLILPNLTIGFDIRWTQISGQALQDLGASIGTADPLKPTTIILPSFTIGEDTTVFTSKGYTIAYA